MDQLTIEILKALAKFDRPETAGVIANCCPSASCIHTVRERLERLLKIDLVGRCLEIGSLKYWLVEEEIENKPVSLLGLPDEVSAERAFDQLDAMLAENQPMVNQYDFLMRSVDHSQQLLDEYLGSVADPGILESLEGMRNLARIQLEQFLNPANEDDLTSGVQRCGTG